MAAYMAILVILVILVVVTVGAGFAHPRDIVCFVAVNNCYKCLCIKQSSSKVEEVPAGRRSMFLTAVTQWNAARAVDL